MSIKKLMTFISTLSFLFCATPMQALNFKAGDQTALKITQQVDLTMKEIKGEVHSTSTLDLTVKILSTDLETGNYPYDVEILINKMNLSHAEKQGKKSKTFTYNSTHAKNSFPMQSISQLVNVPLYFTVFSPNEILETSDTLSNFSWEWDDPAELMIFGTYDGDYLNILKQIFHHAGKDLVLKQCYPVDWNLIVDLDEEDMNNSDVQNHAIYTIQKMDNKKIEATWEGNLKVESKSPLGPFLKIDLCGDVNWDINNPLLQNRTTKMTFKTKELTHAEGTLIQTWTATPL